MYSHRQFFHPHHTPLSVQVRDDLKRFLDSLMSKSGKLRSLIRELRTSYADDDAAQKSLVPKSMCNSHSGCTGKIGRIQNL